MVIKANQEMEEKEMMKAAEAAILQKMQDAIVTPSSAHHRLEDHMISPSQLAATTTSVSPIGQASFATSLGSGFAAAPYPTVKLKEVKVEAGSDIVFSSSTGKEFLRINGKTHKVEYDDSLDDVSRYFWEAINSLSPSFMPKNEVLRREADLDSANRRLRNEIESQKEKINKMDGLLSRLLKDMKDRYDKEAEPKGGEHYGGTYGI